MELINYPTKRIFKLKEPCAKPQIKIIKIELINN